MKSPIRTEKIPFWSLVWRTLSDYALSLFFPREIDDLNASLKKAIDEATRGKGFILVYTHFSLRDAMEVNRSLIFSRPVLRSRYAINPLSYHQFNKPMELMAKSFSGTFYPVVNNSTLKKEKFKNLPKNMGMKEFVNAGAEVLKKGGVITLAVNATRSEKLDIDDPQKPVGYMIAGLQGQGVTDFGLLLVSLELENAKSYAKKYAGGMNFWKKVFIRPVKYINVNDLLKKPEINGRLSAVDVYIRNEIAKAAPKAYL